MECKFCQNWQIAQFRPEQIEFVKLSPEEIVHAAKNSESKTIAYTYSEPVIFYEYMHDIALQARKSQIGSVAISNGYINREPLEKLLKVLTAIKIDLKGFTEEFYKKYCSGELAPVLESLKPISKSGVWFEIDSFH